MKTLSFLESCLCKAQRSVSEVPPEGRGEDFTLNSKPLCPRIPELCVGMSGLPSLIPRLADLKSDLTLNEKVAHHAKSPDVEQLLRKRGTRSLCSQIVESGATLFELLQKDLARQCSGARPSQFSLDFDPNAGARGATRPRESFEFFRGYVTQFRLLG